jgi:uncharacterized protein (DUF58 family)
VPGDDIKKIDWKVFAKNDRYYLKQYQAETNLETIMLLDISGSMSYMGNNSLSINENNVNKLEYAKFLIAAISLLMVRQQDAVGLMTFDSRVRKFLPPKTSPVQIRQILEILHNSAPKGISNFELVLKEVSKRIKNKSTIVIFSDFFGDNSKLLELVRNLRYQKHEVILFHIMADEELTFPFKDFAEFIDLEDPGSCMDIDPKTLRATYIKNITEFCKNLEKGCQNIRADYICLSTATDYVDNLIDYFLRVRKGRG